MFGEAGKHARVAVFDSLPLGVAVEIDGIFQIANNFDILNYVIGLSLRFQPA